MTNTEAAPEAAHAGYAIVVNGVPHTVAKDAVTYDEAIELAFPGQSQDTTLVFQIDFEDAESKPHSGALTQGNHVLVKRHGTDFSVIRSVRA